MKANWMEAFRLALRELNRPHISGVAVHHRVDGEWPGVQKNTAESLTRALSSSAPMKGAPKRYLFPLIDADVVVEVSTDRIFRTSTLRTVFEDIQKIREASQYKFDAHHDALTGCKNRKSFDHAVKSCLASMAAKTPAASSSISLPPAKSVALVTLDIDYFKRINDSHGHDYGDVVLRAFSWHLEDACAKANSESKSASFSLYRLGGEEFNILIAGEMEERDVIAWVESVRVTIQGAFVPTEIQLQVIERDLGASIKVPRLGDRKITASFGVARFSGSVGANDIDEIASRLKTQADKALYSAKQSGRNRVRFFPDILKQYGRVIKNDSSVGIVAIDIGSEIGVVRGREFFVVPERYTGETPYVVDDGRSQRTLGHFPRVRVAKVVAFDVQSEISFCRVTERADGTQIAEGSLLEAIPLGLFGGLSAHHNELDSSGETDGLRALKIKLDALTDSDFAAIAVRLWPMKEIEKAHGQVRANGLLAAASAAITRTLPVPAKVVQVELGQFGAVFKLGSLKLADVLSKLSVAVGSICADIAEFSIGAIDTESLGHANAESFSLKRENAYDYALIAATDAESGGASVFSSESPLGVLSAQEKEGEYEKVIADYLKFKEIGISNGKLDNTAGVAYFWSSGEGGAGAAGQLFKAAVESNPSEPIFHSNYAITQFSLNNYVEAFDHLKQSSELRIEGVLPEDLRAMYAVSAAHCFHKTGRPARSEVVKLLAEAPAIDAASFVDEIQLQEARALADVE